MERKMKKLVIGALVLGLTFGIGTFVRAAIIDVYEGQSIQQAIDNAADDDVINVKAGVYEESLVIDGVDIALVADDEVMLRPISPCELHEDVIQVYNSTVKIDGFQIDANYDISGCLGGIYARGMAELNEGPVHLEATYNKIENYGKNGTTVNGEQATAVITENVVIGRGILEVGDYAQNGIQLGWEASGIITGNRAANHFYNGCSGTGISTCTWVATGILLYDVDPLLAKIARLQADNDLEDNQYDVLYVTSPSISGGHYEAQRP
jgi:hypothetical protein